MIEAATLDEVKPGTMKRVSTGKDNPQHILLCNVDGEYYAIDDLCTHEDFSLSYGCLKGEQVQCSLHGARFNVKTGLPEVEPAEIPLKTYTVIIKNNQILIEI